MRILKIIITLSYVIVTSVKAMPIQDYIHYLPTGTNLSLVVQKVGSKTPFASYQSERLALPASTQKVLIALAASLELGSDFRFTTTFESSSNISQGQLRGPLTVRFSGDPTLSRSQLRSMITKLRNRGIKSISGDLLIDTSIFASHDKAPGWSWNNIAHCYNAPPAAAIIDRNCFSISLQTAEKSGDVASLEIAPNYPIKITSQIRSVSKNAPERKYCELDIVASDNDYILSGCLLQQKRPIYLSFAVQDGANYAGAVIKYELQQAGIKLNGRVKQQTQSSSKGKVLASSQSAPLIELLREMLKHSDNMIADTLFRILGNKYFDVPGTWRSGGDAVRQILRKKAGIDLGNSVIADGSGLSRNNLISADSMMEILQYIAANDSSLNLIDMLPISGVDGTLKGRKSFKDAKLEGIVKAKTGALEGVYNLAGFMASEKGQKIAFVQFISGYAVEASRNSTKRTTLATFESLLYKDIYSNN